jgi:hypothetical protein
MALRPVPDIPRQPRTGLNTDDGGYSPDKFYTATSDKDGNAIRVNVRIPLPVYAAVQRLVQQGKIPDYDSQQAFFRDACFHRLKYLDDNGMADGIGQTLGIMMRLSQMRARNDELEAQREYLNEAEKACVNASEIGDMAHLLETLQNVKDQVAAMPGALQQRARAMVERWERVAGPTEDH